MERIYVHESIFDSFLATYIAEVNKHVLGDPSNPSTTLGPVISPQSAAHIRGQIKEAIANGATPMIPTHSLDHEGSNYVTPQVLTNVTHGMSIMKDETFGPCVGIMKVANDAEAIRYMNDSQFGLTASIWSSDRDHKVEELLDQLEAGTVFLNKADYPHPALAWTGVKLSGRGSTMGAHGFEQFYNLKSYYQKKGP